MKTMFIVISNVHKGPTEVLMCTDTESKAKEFVALELKTQPPGINFYEIKECFNGYPPRTIKTINGNPW